MNALKSNWLDKIMMAITFAEAGEADTARDILNQKQQRPALRVRKETDRRPELRV
jgi:hypothetical protein